MNKLKSRRGETLTETLVAVLVIALSAALLCTMVTTASRLSLAARSNDAAFYDQLSAAETGMGSSGNFKAVIEVKRNGTSEGNSNQVPIQITGDKNALRAYRKG